MTKKPPKSTRENALSLPELVKRSIRARAIGASQYARSDRLMAAIRERLHLGEERTALELVSGDPAYGKLDAATRAFVDAVLHGPQEVAFGDKGERAMVVDVFEQARRRGKDSVFAGRSVRRYELEVIEPAR